ncbi:5bf4f803-a9e0-4910-9db6-30bd7442bce0 [Thermothielavioides terrestris]|uniref:DNA mismatch repair protein PMS1 n=1 Tax=Thermothielavioides terrestris TaxID=2587410 RepID=A0A3S4AKX1_9PEZI|nr:5bf4f803-a9e0-4910-9db6-30bd7442bce0 [Thermothielavioides terrestris]
MAMSSNATIKAIESSTVHRIQAGQVIVDLCSVAKELVENSIDAGATAIATHVQEVRFKNQGLDSIEVQDNGSGIAPHNYESVALKHYTSKLSSYDDLSELQTFGFRGEALSSLCALSRVSIVTCTQQEAPRATRLEFEASGKLKGTSVVSGQRGTTVVVEDLFRNLPVRRRELERNIKREWGKVINLLNQYACVQTGVKFTVSQQPTKGKRMVLFSTKGNPSTRENIINVFGVKTMNALVAMDLKLELIPTAGPLSKGKARADGSSTEVRILGHVSRPSHGEGRQTPDRQMFYINGRPCGLPQFAKVFNEVYRSYNAAQSPFIFADIQLDTRLYDVNVSPDKRTILLHDQGQMLDNLRESLIELFETQDVTIPVAQAPALKPPPFRPPAGDLSASPTSVRARSSRAATVDTQQYSDRSSPDRQQRPTQKPQNQATISSGAKLLKNCHRQEERPRANMTTPEKAKPEVPRCRRPNPRLRRRLRDSAGAAGGADKAKQQTAPLPSFGGRLSQLFSASAHPDEGLRDKIGAVVEEDEDVEAADLGAEEDAEEDSLFVSQVDNEGVPGENDDRADGRWEQLSNAIEEEDVEAGSQPGASLESVDHSPSSQGDLADDDGEHMGEDEKKAQEDRKVQEMINAAEAAAIEPSEEGEKRSQMFVKGRARRKDMTLTLVQQVKTTADEIQRRIAALARHLPQPRSMASAAKSSDGLDADDAEEKLSLKISKSDFAKMKVVGQFNLGFILAVREAEPSTEDGRAEADDDELFIIDQHASDEKYNFERLQATTTVQSQRLVQPKTLELTALEEEIILEHLPALERNGFVAQVDTSGARPVGARAQLLSLPLSRETTFSVADFEELLFLLADNPTSSATTVPRPSKVRKLFAMRACRSSIMIGRALSRRQMERVVRHMGEMEKPWNCPHGRPTMRHLCGLGKD